MGFGKWLKNATRVRLDSHTLGNLVRNAGVIGGAALGGVPGALVAGGVSAARTAARPHANIGDILKSGAGDAATAYGLNKGAQALSSFMGGAPSATVGADVPLDGPVSSGANLAPTSASSGGGVLSSIGHGLEAGAKKLAPQALSLLTGGNGLSGFLDRGLGVAQLVNAANLQKQSTDYAKNAYNQVNQSYGERAPLRVAGLEGMLHPQTQDLSSLQAIQRKGNPFAAPLPVSGVTNG